MANNTFSEFLHMDGTPKISSCQKKLKEMHQEKYNLNWHTYSDHLKSMLHEMMKSDDLTDITLVSDDKEQFKAHKIVLSACSSVFKSLAVIFHRTVQ